METRNLPACGEKKGGKHQTEINQEVYFYLLRIFINLYVKHVEIFLLLQVSVELSDTLSASE